MINFGVGFHKARGSFFNRVAVIRSVAKKKRSVLSKAGAFVMTTAKGLIRSGKGASKPGKPPKSHTGILKNFLFFAYSEVEGSVVVGPVLTNQKFVDEAGSFVSGTVPQVLERGGTVGIFEVLKWGGWRRADLRSRRRDAGLLSRVRRVTIAARPYMAPALEKNLDKFPSLFGDVESLERGGAIQGA